MFGLSCMINDTHVDGCYRDINVWNTSDLDVLHGTNTLMYCMQTGHV